MQLQNGGGDRLASGASRAQFRPMGGAVSQEKWDAMWIPDECQAWYGSDDVCGLPEDSPIHKDDNPNGHRFIPIQKKT